MHHKGHPAQKFQQLCVYGHTEFLNNLNYHASNFRDDFGDCKSSSGNEDDNNNNDDDDDNCLPKGGSQTTMIMIVIGTTNKC